MSLKTATALAIAGAALSVLLGIANLAVPFVQPLKVILYGGNGIPLKVLYLFVPVSYLLFFIAFSSKRE